LALPVPFKGDELRVKALIKALDEIERWLAPETL
jgi:hypothetical protein